MALLAAAAGFEAELERLVAAQVGEATPGDEIGQRLDNRRVWQPVQCADERDDGRLAVGWNARSEAALLLVDRLAESFLDVHAPVPFRD